MAADLLLKQHSLHSYTFSKVPAATNIRKGLAGFRQVMQADGARSPDQNGASQLSRTPPVRKCASKGCANWKIFALGRACQLLYLGKPVHSLTSDIGRYENCKFCGRRRHRTNEFRLIFSGACSAEHRWKCNHRLSALIACPIALIIV